MPELNKKYRALWDANMPRLSGRMYFAMPGEQPIHVTDEQAEAILKLLSEDDPDPYEYKSGDRCLMRVIGGEPLVQHYQCDDYFDGTYTRSRNGTVVTAAELRQLQRVEDAVKE